MLFIGIVWFVVHNIATASILCKLPTFLQSAVQKISGWLRESELEAQVYISTVDCRLFGSLYIQPASKITWTNQICRL